ncbi:MAG: RNase P modulator RnpM [Bacilli bacterium]|jgi:predicted RNA-binding protein YlxR (DUF448 family)|nr:YlxR family protein [Bacillota bacterium]NLI52084.1 YlxR family protein [Erysipelotrichaceae bacterium]OQC50701.1 MAG: hypothetical protein BWX57_00087 [Tenericutes bacterium ADurb.Bin024]HOA11584.1 YlxR family protein [Bacilli bacterium]TAH57985.1 MAG: YlxR family protein [Bacillota bacterium]
MKKIIVRRCIVTHESHEKRDLIRVVRTPDGRVVIDNTGKVNGRGAYLVRNKEVILLAQKKNALSQALNIEVDQVIYEKLLEEVND